MPHTLPNTMTRAPTRRRPGLARLLACLAAASLATGALANPARVGGVRGGPARVEFTLTIQMPTAAGAPVEEQVRQTETARRAIYEMAARECETLKTVFRSECRITAVRANATVQARGNGQESVFVNGSASFDLTDRPDGPSGP